MEWDLWPIIKFTLWQSSLVTVVSLICATGFALLERTRQANTPYWWLAICALPVFLPPLIVGTGFIQLLGQAGYLNSLLSFFQIPTIQFLYRPPAVILAHLYYNIPLAYLAIHSTLHRVSRHTEEAARLLGASPWQLFQTVWWPQLKGAILGIGAVIFLYCWTSFALPLQLGGSTAKTMEVWLYEQIKLYHQPSLALAVAAVQTMIFILPVLLILHYRKQPIQQFTPVITKHRLGITALRWLITAVIMAPLMSLVLRTSLQIDTKTITTLANSQFDSSLIRSLVLMISVIVITILLGFLLRRAKGWTLLLLTLSPVVLAMLWLQLFGQGLDSLITALVISLLPISSYFMQRSYQQLPSALLEAARTLGANRWQQLKLEWRWLWPAARQVMTIGIVLVLGDIALASLLAPTTQPTAMQVAYGLLGSYRFQVGSLALVMMLSVILILQLIIHYFPYADRRQS